MRIGAVAYCQARRAEQPRATHRVVRTATSGTGADASRQASCTKQPTARSRIVRMATAVGSNSYEATRIAMNARRTKGPGCLDMRQDTEEDRGEDDGTMVTKVGQLRSSGLGLQPHIT